MTTLTVVSGRATVQDRGRPGRLGQGLTSSGAVDPLALELANRLVGTAERAAGLEVGMAGVGFTVDRPTLVAVTGARRTIAVGGGVVGANAPFTVAAGAIVTLGPASDEVYSYVAFGGGGVTTAAVLGSRATDTLAGIGTPPLEPGRVVPLGRDPLAAVVVDQAPGRERPDLVRCVRGPRRDWFTEDALQLLSSQTYAVSSQASRVGVGIEGPRPLQRVRDDELRSEPMLPGYVQVPPSGQPFVLLRDHPTTGGYPVIACVLPGDLWIVGQTPPGRTVRLSVVRAASEERTIIRW